MKRVASLYLPDWPIERIVRAERAERTAALPSAGACRDSEAGTQRAEHGPKYGRCREAPSDAGFARGAVPHVGGWRPGARWARAEDGSLRAGQTERAAHIIDGQLRPSRELGHEAEGHPFKPMPPDEGRTPIRNSRAPAQAGAQGRKRDARDPGLLPAQEHRTALNIPKLPTASLVTSIQNGNKLLIAAVSPAARALGIVPGMAVTQARAQVPGLDIRPADPEGDRAALLGLAMLAARRWCPLVAISGDAPDERGLFLDITGTAHLFGGEARMARRIVRLLARHGHHARLAIADTPGAAWALARFAFPPRARESGGPASVTASKGRRGPRFRGDDETMICPPAAHIDLIAPLPTVALRLEPRAIELLKRLGVDTVGQLAALPRAPLVRRFGGALIARLDQMTGRVPEPLDPVVPPEHIAIVQRFAEPIATTDAIAHWLDRLVPALTAKLGEAGQGARVIDLVADRIDGNPQRVRIGVARPSRDPAHLGRLLRRRIETIDPGFGIDALALHVRRSEPLGAQPFGERLDEDAAPDLAPLVDTLAIRIGADRLWRMAPVESDVPERSIVATPPLDSPAETVLRLKQDDVRHLDGRVPDHPWHPRWPRPPRLLRRPEPIDHVMAELPDHAPKRFTWRGRTYRVVRADGPERIGGEWWQRPSERDSIRDYFQVEDETGQRFWLFRRGDGERAATGDLSWYIHGSFG